MKTTVMIPSMLIVFSLAPISRADSCQKDCQDMVKPCVTGCKERMESKHRKKCDEKCEEIRQYCVEECKKEQEEE